MRVYYLTGAQSALSNLALGRVKISRFADLNDPFELLAVDLKDKEHRKAFRATKEKLNGNKGLICLSRSWSNPVLWGHYAEKHTGIALGFEVEAKHMANVIYAKTPLKIPIDKKTNRPILSESLMDRLLRTKFHDWKYEDEMRIFVGLDHKTKESGMYFYDFSADFQLREVVLGPKCELPIASIRAIVAGYSPQVIVTKSRIAFSSFRVVENIVASAK
ncbi:MAG: hypothetical protein JWQ01_3093 [Massilia sp.]|nr:hypothetical protein [Massilia sp.]